MIEEPAAMGSEAGLALQLCAMRTVGGFVKDAATESGGGRAARLAESIKILEEEKRKIEAFKRELPLCMHLLGEVIDGLKEETERCGGGGCFGRVLEELLPVESKVEEDGGVKVEDKMNWMSSAQLWSDNYGENDIGRNNHEDGRRQGKENLLSECKSPGGAFIPFEALSTVSGSSEEKKPAAGSPDLVASVAESRACGGGPKSVGRAPATVCGDVGFQTQHQPSRKARRCWSQELHRRFTLAIQQLGGAQGEWV
ncbi:hypothetical protein OPV22_004421 [Ensete ventricosum]|uniref:HHO5-like N-terminal domain-containing protein n=1 Tax=Ensete ventricosum TaxID=4639 RepID=A0AAV8S3E3_ENSVE|nr:hypothetical protein OPV22_004421 [Ensete ventricosum]